MDENGDALCFGTKQEKSIDGCSDKEGSPSEAREIKAKIADGSHVDNNEQAKESEAVQPEAGTVPDQEPSNNQAQNTNKNKNRGQKRRQRNNVHRIPTVSIPSLFPVPMVQDSFDLRNVLSGQGSADLGPWWHRPHQHNFQQNSHQPTYQQTKKPRTDPNWKKKQQNNQNTPAEKSEEPIEDIINPLKYAVVPTDYPNTLLTEEQFDRLQTLLMDNILNIEDDDFIPRFWRSYMRHGALLLFLADEESTDWLVNTLPTLSLNDDIKLKTGPAKDIILTRKVNIVIPKLLKDLDEAKVLKLLKSQNPSLKCHLWQVLSCQDEEKGRNMTIALDEESYKINRINQFKAHLGLGIIKFTNAQHYNVIYNTNN